jgi:alanine racemase
VKVLEINQNDLKYNLEQINNYIDTSKTKIIAVVKANGMGLDLVKYSKFLIENGIEILAVANAFEAVELRKAGITSEILMLSEVYSEEEIEILIDNTITLTIGSLDEKNKIQEIAKSKEKCVQAHVKIDTGFARFGFIYNDESKILEAVKSSDNLKITGVYTHFSKPIDSKWTHIQFERFKAIIPKIKEVNEEAFFHCSSSTAMILYPEMNLDAVRLGSCIQGRVLKNPLNLKRIGVFKSEIITIKELQSGYNISYGTNFKAKKNMKVAVVSVGYIDGFNLKNSRDDFSTKNNIISVGMEIKKVFLKPKLTVKINNEIFNVVGRLGMYHAIIDITKGENIKVGNEVIFNIPPLYTNIKIRREYI